MYPNNQDIEIFGEQVSWPGVDADGKFTNGSFDNPMAKPSFIPAETINLVLDNLQSIITKCGGTPNATGAAQIANLITHLATAGSWPRRQRMTILRGSRILPAFLRMGAAHSAGKLINSRKR
jgi:hypothetical protein